MIANTNELKRLRLLANITQEDLGKQMGVSKNYISMCENNKKNSSEDFCDRYMNALNEIEYERRSNKLEK